MLLTAKTRAQGLAEHLVAPQTPEAQVQQQQQQQLHLLQVGLPTLEEARLKSLGVDLK